MVWDKGRSYELISQFDLSIAGGEDRVRLDVPLLTRGQIIQVAADLGRLAQELNFIARGATERTERGSIMEARSQVKLFHQKFKQMHKDELLMLREAWDSKKNSGGNAGQTSNGAATVDTGATALTQYAGERG